MPFQVKHVSGFSELIVLQATAGAALEAVYRLLTDDQSYNIVITTDGNAISLDELTLLALDDAPSPPAPRITPDPAATA